MFKQILLSGAVVAALTACGAEENKDAQNAENNQEIEFKMPEAQMPDFKSFLPEKIAKIGDKTFTRDELIAKVKQMAENNMQFQFMTLPNLKDKETVRRALIDPMIDEMVVTQLAEKAGFKPSRENAEKMFDERVAALPASEKAALEGALAQQNTTLAQYRERYCNDENVQKQMAIGTFIEKEVASKLPKPDSAALAALDNDYARASHILIKVEKTDSAEAKTAAKMKLQEIANRIEKGEDFAKLAAEYSDCPSGKSQGGDLGYNQRGRMVKEFDDQTFSLKPGQTSGVFETQFGYHIVRRTEPQAADRENILKDDQISKAVKDFIEKGKKDLGVEIYL